MSRVIFHVDLNAFFANAEVSLNPSLKNKPIAIGGNTSRGVVSTASYEARLFGVKSAMPISEALLKCPQLMIVEPHFEYYSELSEKFITILKKYSPLLEQASIDECYIDVTEPIKRYKRPLDLAFEIQKKIYEGIHIPCSIGVAPNKFLAKMASDLKKPEGISIIRIKEVKEKLWPLPIEDMHGIGKTKIDALHRLNIFTIGDFAQYTKEDELIPLFKNHLSVLKAKAHGIDQSPIVTESLSKSISNMITFHENTSDYEELSGILLSISRHLIQKLKKEGLSGYTLSITIRYSDFSQISRSRKSKYIYANEKSIYESALSLFDEYYEEKPVRLLGIGISDLIPLENIKAQFDLFEQQKPIDTLVHDLKTKFQSGNFMKASDLLKRK